MNLFSKKESINCNGKLIMLDKPIVMGILNITPDSFYDGGKYNDLSEVEGQIKRMLNHGASIIDVGAYSSRPGAKHISEEEELRRLTPVLQLIKEKFSTTIVSVDTFRSGIAEEVVKNYGVSIINDISAGEMDSNMFNTIASLNVPYIIMHMKGTPQNMQQNPSYKDVTNEIISYFSDKINQLKKLGVHDIIIDPGFGFGKTIEHNYELLNNLNKLRIFELPVLAGVSRKSMIYKYLNKSPEEALNGTTVLNTIALSKGANILRVHDVKEAVETVKLFNKTVE